MNALSLALYYLGRKARTESELRDKLALKLIPQPEIETAIIKLKGYGYLDDSRFAIDFQRARNAYRPTGLSRLRLELRQKGVPKEIVETVQAEAADEFVLALAAAQTRRRQYAKLTPEVFHRRMTAFLARRGFGYSIIKSVLQRLKGDQ